MRNRASAYSYCPQCGKQTDKSMNFCPFCGASIKEHGVLQGVELGGKPIVGIIVAVVFGLVGIILASLSSYGLSQEPMGIERELCELFPGLVFARVIGSSFSMIGHIALLIGALLCFFILPKGKKIILITSCSMIAITIFITALIISGTIGTSNWSYLEPPLRKGFIIGLLSLFIGGVFQWGLILSLFTGSTNKR